MNRNAMKRRVLTLPLLPLLVLLGLSGCASTLSGVGGTERYACKAPEGAMCTSVSGVYANSMQGMPTQSTLPGSTSTPPSPDDAIPYGAAPLASAGPTGITSSAIRSAPRLLRLWIAPWEDADGDLHEASLIHLVVDTGRWLIEHVRPASHTRMDGVVPPASRAQDATKTTSEAPPAPTRLPLPPAAMPSDPDSAVMEP